MVSDSGTRVWEGKEGFQAARHWYSERQLHFNLLSAHCSGRFLFKNGSLDFDGLRLVHNGGAKIELRRDEVQARQAPGRYLYLDIILNGTLCLEQANETLEADSLKGALSVSDAPYSNVISSDDNRHQLLSLLFDRSSLPAPLLAQLRTPTLVNMEDGVGRVLHGLISSAVAGYSGLSGSECSNLRGMFYDLFSATLRHQLNEVPLEEQAIVTEIRRLIDQHYRRPDLNLDDIGRTLGLSGRTLRRCLAQANLSFMDLLRQRRCTAMRDLLCETRMPRVTVLYAALSSGFGDVNTAIRSFRRTLDTTPHQMRKITRR